MNNTKALKKDRLRVVLVNTVMILSVVLIVGVLILITMGYGINSDLNVERRGLVQFISHPSGATISINDEATSSRTPTKSMLLPGTHHITINRPEYDTWSKSINVEPGSVLWLDYVRLIPTQKRTDHLKDFSDIISVST